MQKLINICLFYHQCELMCGWFAGQNSNTTTINTNSSSPNNNISYLYYTNIQTVDSQVHKSSISHRRFLYRTCFYIDSCMDDYEIAQLILNSLKDVSQYYHTPQICYQMFNSNQSGEKLVVSQFCSVIQDVSTSNKQSYSNNNTIWLMIHFILLLETHQPIRYLFTRIGTINGKDILYRREPEDHVDKKVWTIHAQQILAVLGEAFICLDSSIYVQLGEEFSVHLLKRLYNELKSLILLDKESIYYDHLYPLVQHAIVSTLKVRHVNDKEKDAFLIVCLRVLQNYVDDRFKWTLPYVYLQRCKVAPKFPSSVWELAKAFKLQHQPNLGRDMPRGVTFTIDSKWTKDYDDAISILDYKHDEYVHLQVHITDVTQLFRRGTKIIDNLTENLIFAEALHRVTSHYIPGLEDTPLSKRSNDKYMNLRMFPMLPECVSTKTLSLCANQYRNTVTYEFKLYANGEYKFESLYLSDNVFINQNLTFDEADDKIQNAGDDQFWKTLSKCCQAMYNTRSRTTGMPQFNNNRELYIVRRGELDDDSQVEVLKCPSKASSSSIIVSELAILVNSAAGNFCHENGLPTLYKAQKTDPETRRSKSFITNLPSGNDVMGSTYYSTQTSPLRRLQDLISQLSLVQYLLNGRKDLFNADQLSEWSKKIDTKTNEKQHLEKQIVYYWVVVHLRNNLENLLRFTLRVQYSGYDRDSKTIRLSLVDLNNYPIIAHLHRQDLTTNLVNELKELGSFTVIIRNVRLELYRIEVEIVANG